MAGFDLSELLPYYLDETDEQIEALNEALLKLERDPADDAVLREAFRMVHSIKGSSTVMGFDQVKRLTHHLETYFDQLRAGQRTLDRPTLDLSFRCLDGLRDYHLQLRSGNQDAVDLSGLTRDVLASLENREVAAPPPEGIPALDTPTAPPVVEEPECLRVTVHFSAGLAWADMKAKLVLNRLSGRSRVLATEPSAESIDGIEQLSEFTTWLIPECDLETLRSLADVEGVTRIVIEPENPPKSTPSARSAELVSPSPSPEAEPSPVFEPEPAPVVVPEPAPVVVPEPALVFVPEPAPVVAPEPAPVVAPEPPAVVQPEPTVLPGPGMKPTTKKVGETLRVDVDRLDQLMNLAGELVINRSRFYEIASGLEGLFRDSSASFLTADTQDRLESLTRDLEAFAEQPSRAGVDGGTGTSGGALDRWIAQFRRLRENFKVIQDELDAMRRGRDQINALSEAIHQLARVTDGIQKGVLDTRMVPIGPLFERFQRVIRDLRVLSNKEVTLHIEGEKTELDKRMIDELADPLIHMVRNSVDHGLEMPDEREKAGKPRSGTVTLHASHRGNSVVIIVGDDGRGIDSERVREKVVAKGLLSAEEARRLTDRQLVGYIWHPGLSTAEAITDISGRGVGMDIVKSRIENLNGTVDVRSEKGRGTTFTIRLPLTLAIMPCLLVQIFEEVYAIPLDHIDEIVEVETRSVNRVQGKRMIEIRDRLVSLVALDDLLVWGGDRHPVARNKSGIEADKRTVVVAHNGETTVGLLVDHLIGMQEIVLKPLEKNFRPVPALSGASILGDGRVSLILDIDALIAMVVREASRQVG
ncbi:chemotaxis protein CheA [Tundrisphaera lichenicola]|uniref:chemotaxis protein CheA n=1 Tax=Tundrisphaera lichenicola TaxID=2029860 RepID=UPI003EBCA3F1